jgi:hypothetical protein
MTDQEMTERMETYAIGELIDVDGCVINESAKAQSSRENNSANSEGAHEIVVEGIKSQRYLQTQFMSACKNFRRAIRDCVKGKSSRGPSGFTTRWNYKWEVHDPDWFATEREEVYMPDSDTVKIVLLIIDPQNDFHDDPGDKRGYKGTLAVEGATADSLRISEMIRKHGEDIDEIYVTLDTHHVSSRKICLCAFMTFGI